MGDWIGPAIVAAFIAALVSVAGWFVTAYQTIRHDRRRRAEKARDFQIALRAEVRGELAELTAFDLGQDLERVRTRYRADAGYVVLVPQLPRAVVFDAILDEIHVLAEEVIDPVVLYMRKRQVVAGVIEDIRAPAFRDLARERQLEIYAEYIDLSRDLLRTAEMAAAALNRPTP